MLRSQYFDEIKDLLRIHKICGILGPRQVGKTTLARMYIDQFYPNNARIFDLENPLDLAQLENPMLTLSNVSQELIVIDEIQRRPDLFPVLRVLADATSTEIERKRKFLILGSASRDLIRQSSETLAGRIGYIELPPFSLMEVKESKKLWVRGGFPRSYLAETDADSYKWRQQYIMTFLENDIPLLGFNIPAEQMRRFWLMLAHYHGQIYNASEISRSLSVSYHTVNKYLDILVGTFMMRRLTPWVENIQKRQVKSPKIYFRDSGILNALLLISSFEELQVFPRLGSFWEGFALEQIILALQATPQECFYWATHTDAELDLFMIKGGKRLGFEFKYGDRPTITKSMRIALNDLKLDHLSIIYPGKDIFPMDTKITAYGLESLATKEFQNAIKLALHGRP